MVCYTRDAGHCIAVAVAKAYQPGDDAADFLAACPVRAVLAAGWQLRDGYVVVDLPYDEQLGLVIDESHEEF